MTAVPVPAIPREANAATAYPLVNSLYTAPAWIHIRPAHRALQAGQEYACLHCVARRVLASVWSSSHSPHA
eukprot:12047267-Alexandrium_andersonii.AAC.1